MQLTVTSINSLGKLKIIRLFLELLHFILYQSIALKMAHTNSFGSKLISSSVRLLIRNERKRALASESFFKIFQSNTCSSVVTSKTKIVELFKSYRLVEVWLQSVSSFHLK